MKLHNNREEFEQLITLDVFEKLTNIFRNIGE